MRHILVHAYYSVDLDTVWRVAVADLPPLAGELERTLADWPADEPKGG